jgi:hypothetical protein
MVRMVLQKLLPPPPPTKTTTTAIERQVMTALDVKSCVSQRWQPES